MKLLKQILILIVFAGAIFGVFTFVTKDNAVVNTAALSAGNHEQLLAEIDRDWKDLSNWDEETYNRNMTMVNQSLNANIINDLDSRTLKDRINKSAYQKCVAAMNREFGKADCDASKLADNFAGLQTILMNERGLASNSQIVDITKVYNLYNRIIAFNNKSFNMSPRFNGNNSTWNSWTGHQDRIISQMNEFVNDPIYQNRLKGITAIAEISKTHSKLADARSKYYDQLDNEMCSYYRSKLNDINNMSESLADGGQSERNNLKKEIYGIRAQLANEKYINPHHSIFSDLLNIL